MNSLQSLPVSSPAPELSPLETAVLRWWRGRRPITWTRTQHRAEPLVNTNSFNEHDMAILAAQIDATQPSVAGE